MTAIAGILHFDGAPVDSATLERMQNVLAPYGRDAQHHWRQGHVAMLRTLLRITSEDGFDRQPLHHADSDTHLVFDGRLDNRTELIHDLNISSQESGLMADSDLVMRAILRWGTEAVSRFVGDFALACWQARNRRLWLARDPLGHRPLFWHRQPGFIAFATLPKALFAIPGIPRAICEERLADQLLLLPTTGPESHYKDIYRVEPGQIVVVADGRISTRRYHTFDPEREIELPSDDDYLEAFSEHLEKAVSSQLRSNGAIASHLSSGFDSSTVTAMAARQLGKRSERLIAYTAVPREGFDSPVLKGRHADESPGARAVAARFDNIDHILIRQDSSSPLDNLQCRIEDLDREVTNPCNMPWLDAIQTDAAYRGAKVLLTGQMGNMTLSYNGKHYLPSLFGKGQWLRWWKEASALKRAQPHWRWRGLLVQSIGPYLPAWLWMLIEKHRDRGTKLTDYTAIHPDFLARIGQARIQQSGWDTSYRPPKDGRRIRIAVINRHDGGEYYSAANLGGLEMRDPTGDLRLLEFCLAVPDHQYLRNGQTRWLLQRAMKNILPPEILNAKSRGLQAADWYETTTASLPEIRETIQNMIAHGAIGQYLDLEKLQTDLDHWSESDWARYATVQTYRLKLLRGLSIGTFIQYVTPKN